MNEVLRVVVAVVVLSACFGGAGHLFVSAAKCYWKAFRLSRKRVGLTDARLCNEAENPSQQKTVQQDSAADKRAKRESASAVITPQDLEFREVKDDVQVDANDAPETKNSWAQYDIPACLRKPSREFIWS